MAIQRKPYINKNGEEFFDKEVIYSDSGFSIIVMPDGYLLPQKIVNKVGSNKYYRELIEEAGQFPPDRFEEEIEVI